MIEKLFRKLLLVTALAAGGLMPQASAARPPEDPGRFIAKHADRLGLEPATLSAIERIVAASRERNEVLWKEAGRAREALHGLLSGASPEREAVLSAASAVDVAMANLHHDRLEALLQIHALLTPAQREELVRIREEARAGRRGRGCAADVAALCAEASPGAATLRCLADRYESLSPGCRGAAERLREEHHGRFRRP